MRRFGGARERGDLGVISHGQGQAGAKVALVVVVALHSE